MSDAGVCPRCGRAGSMCDLGDGLVWCEDCNVGWTDEDDAFEGDDEADGLDHLLVVATRTGVVHRWFCALTMRAPLASWRPEMAGLDDRACTACLPDGLPVSPPAAESG